MEKLELTNATKQRSNMQRVLGRWLGLGTIALSATLSCHSIAIANPTPTASESPTPQVDRHIAQQITQRIRVREVWRQVYEQLPDLPLENEYVQLETGDVDAEDTLISRLIRYHVYVKGRPPQYRLDWKLTLADYLGANDLMFEGVYPGGNEFESNPLYGDREAIADLSRSQRDELVHTLTSLFNPQYLPLLEAAANQQEEPTSPTPERLDRNPPRQPQTGDAQLLLP
ncbi:MAG: hypothetical protein SWY16_01175 [Cyanobacteriota bacterium]|nr:hypothetical protein [Cyanobacteriota bacterium]